jgi:hypothetical protein
MKTPYILGALALLTLSFGAGAAFATGIGSLTTITRAAFDGDGNVLRPNGYRGWVHVSTRWKPIGVTILDGSTTSTPEIMNVYVEPGAYRSFLATGKWPEGAQIVKEFSATLTDAKLCGPEPSFICSKSIGTGIFETGYTGLGMMVKDSRRFPDKPGNWAYFSFGHKPAPYDAKSPARSDAQCSSCHVAGVGPAGDYVFSAGHIGLARVKGQAAVNSAAGLR